MLRKQMPITCKNLSQSLIFDSVIVHRTRIDRQVIKTNGITLNAVRMVSGDDLSGQRIIYEMNFLSTKERLYQAQA